MKLGTLMKAAGIEDFTCNADIEITKIVTDSRKACPGCMFVCIRGIHTDGHDFIGDALERGATVIVTEDGKARDDGDGIFVNVSDTRRAVAFFYDAYYGFPSKKMKFIGVTGTNGKTSVTFMLKAIFEAAFYRCGLVGTVNSIVSDTKINIRSENKLANMTTPDPEELYHILAVMAEENVEYVFMEVTSHALKLHKPDAINFDMALFTNLTPEHLDFHGNMNDYFDAKARLFKMAKRGVVCADSEYGKKLLRVSGAELKSCSRGDMCADYRAEKIKNCGTGGIEYSLCYEEGKSFTVKSSIPGDFTVSNTLLAASAALWEGIAPTVIQKALEELKSVDGRMEKVDVGEEADFSVFIDYAHTPDALENLLRSARGFRHDGERVVVLFGCGGDRDKTKRQVMGRIASELADFTVVTSDNSRSEDPDDIIRNILEGVDSDRPFAVIPDRAEAIEFTVRNARRGDIILLAGKGHEAYEIDREGVHPFSERKIVTEAYKKYKRK